MSDENSATTPSTSPASIDEAIDLVANQVFEAAEAEENPASTSDAEAEGGDEAAPQRDEQGRFAAKAAEKQEDEPEPAAETVDPPKSWSRHEHDAWRLLPAEVQKALVERDDKRNTDFEAIRSKADASERALSEFRTAFEPFRDRLAYNGVTEVQALNQLLAAQKLLDQDAVTGLQHLARTYGVDLSQFGRQQQPGEADNRYVDPEIAELKRQNQELSRHLRTLQQAQQQSAATTQQMQQNAALAPGLRTIEEFRTAKNEDGSPAYPHFDALQSEIAAQAGLLRQGNPSLTGQDLLSQAYEQAVWSRPDLRSERLKAEQARWSDEQRKRQAEDADRAAKAQRVNVRPSGHAQGSPSLKGKSWESTIDNVAASIGS